MLAVVYVASRIVGPDRAEKGQKLQGKSAARTILSIRVIVELDIASASSNHFSCPGNQEITSRKRPTDISSYLSNLVAFGN